MAGLYPLLALVELDLSVGQLWRNTHMRPFSKYSTKTEYRHNIPLYFYKDKLVSNLTTSISVQNMSLMLSTKKIELRANHWQTHCISSTNKGCSCLLFLMFVTDGYLSSHKYVVENNNSMFIALLPIAGYSLAIIIQILSSGSSTNFSLGCSLNLSQLLFLLWQLGSVFRWFHNKCIAHPIT